ncbi:hypothetical protein LINPERHAP1_LOCUS13527 [Linum perenne]
MLVRLRRYRDPDPPYPRWKVSFVRRLRVVFDDDEDGEENRGEEEMMRLEKEMWDPFYETELAGEAIGQFQWHWKIPCFPVSNSPSNSTGIKIHNWPNCSQIPDFKSFTKVWDSPKPIETFLLSQNYSHPYPCSCQPSLCYLKNKKRTEATPPTNTLQQRRNPTMYPSSLRRSSFLSYFALLEELHKHISTR